MTTRPEQPAPSRWLPVYIAGVVGAAVLLGVLSWTWGRRPDLAPLLLLAAMGVLSFQLREPTVTSRIGFSFLSIILLASGAILGPFGAWCVGLVSPVIDRDRKVHWFQRLFNAAMMAIIGVAGGWAYALSHGSENLAGLSGLPSIATELGLPLLIADIVQCLTNALLLAGVIHLYQGVPFLVFLRRVLVSSGVAYVGYGAIGFLFVIVWFPAGLGPFSAVLILAPLLAARWAFIQFGDELRSHERTVDTLVTALATKEPAAADRSLRVARLAEWVAEEMGLGPSQIGTVRYAAMLHEIGHLGVPTRLLRRPRASLTASERRVVDRHCVLGARMIEGIDFLEPARSGIRHQGERFDGRGTPDGLVGPAIPVVARVLAVVVATDDLTAQRGPGAGAPTGHGAHAAHGGVVDELSRDPGRFDPAVLLALRAALDKHGLAAATVGAADRA
ncbi:HD domain-containing protein [Humibacillus xanthopallidus]|uniref:HD domain-containing protein n=1 Tax=Humibacillus xanthopallidus TaxID=412689 RepID=A0A543PS32_9MICO|nr:HD domain-containing phosphohydrolase [Humibacillus xanthopallidus]TQN46882.1 HD domain-containing protein [Humibacillus xanthopallidus]